MSPKSVSPVSAMSLESLRAIGYSNMTDEQRKRYKLLNKQNKAARVNSLLTNQNDVLARHDALIAEHNQFLADMRALGGYKVGIAAWQEHCKRMLSPAARVAKAAPAKAAPAKAAPAKAAKAAPAPAKAARVALTDEQRAKLTDAYIDALASGDLEKAARIDALL